MNYKLFPALICLWLPLQAFAGGWQGFLRLDTISGSSADPNHSGWMDVQSATTTQITNSGKSATNGGFVFKKFTDAASPALALDCALKRALISGTLDLANTNSSLAVFLRLNLTNVTVTSVSTSGGGRATPTESLSLQAQIISWKYTRFNPSTGLVLTNVGSLWNLGADSFSSAGGSPVFMNTGIRTTTGVELDWNATANTTYRIYAANSLTQPFLPIAVATNTPGPASYFVNTDSPSMFYIIEQIPAGF